MMRRIALFGGSFNPVHHGHLIVARSIRERLALERVIFIPAAQPPHKAGKELAPADDRWRMLTEALDGEPGFEASDWEIRRPGPNYTIDTVLAFREMLGPETEISWIVGGDWLGELGTWRRASELLDLCRIITVGRPGWDRRGAMDSLRPALTAEQIGRLVDGIIDAPLIEISSTDIRARVAAGRSIRFLVPEGVRRHIEQGGLYRGSDKGIAGPR